MNESNYQQLLEASWRRKLSAAEEASLEAHLARHPEAQSDWETEASLTQLLTHLPDAPLSSNFTARVLQALDREASAKPRPWRWLVWLQRLAQHPLPKLAGATVFTVLTAFAIGQYQSFRHEKMADGLMRLSHLAATADPRVFEDFDAIQGLSQASTPADDALFAVLNQNP